MPAIMWYVRLKSCETNWFDTSSEPKKNSKGCLNWWPPWICVCNLFRSNHSMMFDTLTQKEENGNIQRDDGSSERNGASNHELSFQRGPNHMNKSYCNFGRLSLILLHFITPLCYTTLLGAATALSIQETKNKDDRCENEVNNASCHKYYKGYFYSTIPFYILSTIGTVQTLYYSIGIYLNHAYKNAYLRQCLKQDRETRDKAIENFISLIDQRFFQRATGAQMQLSNSNLFSAFFILDSFLYGAAYILYMFIEGKLDSIPRYIIVTMLGTSALLLLSFMVLMNTLIDKAKDTLLYLESYQHLKRQLETCSSSKQTQQSISTEVSSPNQNNKIISLQTIINYFDSYATIFAYAPKIPTLLGAIAAVAIPKVVLFVLRDHGIIKD